MHYLIKESYTVDYAGFWLRLAAIVTDVFILWGLNYVISGIWNLQAGIPWSGREVGDIGTAVAASSVTSWVWRVLAIFLVQAAYFICFWAWRGQTPGKMALRIKIVRFDGSKIGWAMSVMRYLGYIISGVLFMLGFLWVLLDGRHQGWHDKIADTFVVRTSRIKSPVVTGS